MAQGSILPVARAVIGDGGVSAVTSSAATRHRAYEDGLLVATGAILAVAGWELITLAPMMRPGSIGVDFWLYVDAARSWLAGDGFYQAHQLAGPYEILQGDVLYPPTLLWLLVPFTVLPEVLWFAVPALMSGWAMWVLRPARWTWPLIALPLAEPHDLGGIIHGNPIIWITGLTWLGIAYGWGGAFVWLKPSLAPFLLLGVRWRRWWLATALLGVLSLPFLPMFLDYAHVIFDSQNGGLFYSLPQAPLLVGPVVAWFGSRRGFARLVAITSSAPPSDGGFGLGILDLCIGPSGKQVLLRRLRGWRP